IGRRVPLIVQPPLGGGSQDLGRLSRTYPGDAPCDAEYKTGTSLHIETPKVRRSFPGQVASERDWRCTPLQKDFMRHSGSTAKMFVKECGDLSKCILGFRHAIVELILGVRFAFKDFEFSFDAGLTQLAVNAHRVAEQQIACTGGQDGWRKAVHVPVDGGEQRIAERGAVRI